MKAKLEKSIEFRERMQLKQEKYRIALQRAYYSDITAIDQDIIKEAGKDVAGRPVFVFYGDLQPENDKLLDKLYLYLVKWLDEEFNKRPEILQGNQETRGFTLVYFNTFCESSSNYEDFRGMLRTFPCRILLSLNYLIVVHPMLRVKSLDWIVIGTVNNELKDRTHYVDHVQKCEKYGVIVNELFLRRLRAEIKEYDFSEKKSKKVRAQPIVEKKEVERILEKKQAKKKLEDYEISEIGVPVLLKTLVLYMKMNPSFLALEGIFRKSVSIDEEKEAAAHLHSEDYDYLQSISNGYLVATLLKRFLTNLAEPLFPFSTYRKLAMINHQDPACVSSIREIVKTLPCLNFTTLMFLLKFFVQEIVPRHQQNKMTSYNSAVVLLPCLLWSQLKTLDDLTLGKSLAKVLQVILLNFEYVFGDEKEQNKKYRESSRKSRKKFENKLFQHQEQEEEERRRTSYQYIEPLQHKQKQIQKHSPTGQQHLQPPPELARLNIDFKPERYQQETNLSPLVVGEESQPQSINQSKAHLHPGN